MAVSKTKQKKRILVIVESPSKAKTIGKYLGANYKVIASVGHVRDLPKSKLGIDIEDNFNPQYISIRGKGDVIKEIRKEAKNASKVYLATDPDREGEAISWHLAYLLGIDENEPVRIVFNEITKKAIKEAVKNPRKIDISLVDAQQARRVLDRLVGYQISPLLWRKIRRGLSAGRVQSAALKIICDREKEIRSFVPEEYWNIFADFKKEKKFTAKLEKCDGKKITISDGEAAGNIVADLEKGKFTVSNIERKETVRKPYAPFTTSTLQQEASSRINFNTKKTMFVAQQLYEGVNIKGHGTIGLVTYIRTDSVRISDEAKSAAKDFIISNYGDEYYQNNFYSNKKKEVQDAHEAIRPADITLKPSDIEGSLTPDQFKLYDLIWRRFTASQMSYAKFDSMNVFIENGRYQFKASGSKLLFDGYRKVYKALKSEDEGKMLPALSDGEELKETAIRSEQNFTQPPSRFTEAGLVKYLEEKNIGRPSTYAPIIGTLAERRYISRARRVISPTDLGFVVNDMMEHYFKEVVDAGFTAEMEDKLDDIEVKGIDWKKVVADFYAPLSKEIEIADSEIEKIEIEDEPTGEFCELCGKPLVKKAGRFGDFIACSGYPECKNTKAIVVSTGVACPSCGKDLIQRKSRRGKVFYGCSGYPDCSMVFWNKPINEKCPKCGSLLVEKNGKEIKHICSNPECKYVK